MNELEPLFTAIDEGRTNIILSGRSLSDVGMLDGRAVTLEEIVRLELQKRGKILLTLSRQDGITYNLNGYADKIVQEFKDLIEKHNLHKTPDGPNPIPTLASQVIRLLKKPSRITDPYNKEAFLSIIIRLLHGDYELPYTDPGILTAEQLDALLTFFEAGESLPIRKYGHGMLLEGAEGRFNRDIRRLYTTVRLPYPDQNQKKLFIQFAMKRYADSRLEHGLTVEDAARIASFTPNLSTEESFRGSDRSRHPVTARHLWTRKEEDLMRVSEGTLRVLTASRTSDLEGTYLQPAKNILLACSDSLRHGRSETPTLIVLVGPPGTGKTHLAELAAAQAGVLALELLSSKGSLVGETERLTKVQQALRKEFAPNVTIADEITELLPLERNDFDGDSGATRAVIAALLTSLADPEMAGRSLLVGTTNCPYRMGNAIITRCTFIPVFSPGANDYLIILMMIANRIHKLINIDEITPFQKAADLFRRKGASPRDIVKSLNGVYLEHERLTDELIVEAAHDYLDTGSRDSIIYTDLWALNVCNNKRYLPWTNNPDYPIPEHFDGIVNPENGEIDRRELGKRIKELEPYVNI